MEIDVWEKKKKKGMGLEVCLAFRPSCNCHFVELHLSTIQIWSLTTRLLIHKPWGRTRLFDSHLTLRSIPWQRLCKLTFSIKIVEMIVARHPWTWPTDSVVLGFILVDWMQATQFWHQGFIYLFILNFIGV